MTSTFFKFVYSVCTHYAVYIKETNANIILSSNTINILDNILFIVLSFVKQL